MIFSMRLLASAIVGALFVSAAPANIAGGHEHEHEHSLVTRADGTKVAVVACMDPRINMDFLLKQLSLTSANSYIVRNAGGRAKEALRSVIVSQEFLGTSEVHVVHHTDCGMANQSEGSMRKRFYKSDDKSRTVMVNDMEFLPIRTTNYTESVLDDTALIESHPLVKAGSKVTGWIYNIGGSGNDTLTQVYPTAA
ncbi:Carbonic anhydrase [Rhizoctonia solani]|uniref:Carbonic anhydrase n=1 Tax=Rhizoctonia solani TaxID=456999 RepID=A0A8H7H8L8_9AGAM|nr:Carbonic anhydrase [Rhizoctonia solani]